LQGLSWNLMRHFNGVMTSKHWASVYNGDTAFTNGNGWDNAREPDDQRRDYVNDRYRGYDDPKLMKAIICAGSFYRGVVQGSELVMVPGIHGIDSNKPLPSIQTIINNNWYFYATLNSTNPSPFGQGQLGHVVVPYFLRMPSAYPLAFFERWKDTKLPNPYRFGG
jgi:hypothetical protein